MHIKLHFLLLFIFIFIIEKTVSKESSNAKVVSTNHKKHDNVKNTSNHGRNKRSFDDDENPFWANRGRRFASAENGAKFNSEIESNERALDGDKMEKEPPFWGNRGRRDSSATERFPENDFPLMIKDSKYSGTNCKHCAKPPTGDDIEDYFSAKYRRDEVDSPFWGSRGRRDSEEEDYDNSIPTVPFWGNRGRREEENPFWGARGRRQEVVPFWGSRGRRHNFDSQLNVNTEDPPFWGNRGRRSDSENYYKNEEQEPFWGSRGRRLNIKRQKENLRQFLRDAINKVEDNIENLIRSRRDNGVTNSFWNNRGRDSQLKYLFKGGRHRFQAQGFLNQNLEANTKPSASSTVLDDRMFAEQPHYIVVERSSRSSGEDDPFFISRGKKKLFTNSYDISKAVRDRRGSIEELVKSVRNDPYYIARGKKDSLSNITGNFTLLNKQLGKAKELICATIDLIFNKDNNGVAKRDIHDNERDRRTILKKIAAQLQMDPYFVSRGKKNDSGINEDNLQDFVNEVSTKCN